MEPLQSNCDIRWLGWLGSQHYTQHDGRPETQLEVQPEPMQHTRNSQPRRSPCSRPGGTFRESLSRVDLSHWAWPASGPAVTLRREQLVASLFHARPPTRPRATDYGGTRSR